jgi:transcription antitermination protein NusB
LIPEPASISAGSLNKNLSSRTKSRKMALDAIFAADLRKINPIELLDGAAKQQLGRQNQAEIVGYARQIVAGVATDFEAIDNRIEAFSHKWSVERMPSVDRAILRIAVWEILFNDDVPDPVVIAEAVELAKLYSTGDSGAFVNGLLGAIAGTKSAK